MRTISEQMFICAGLAAVLAVGPARAGDNCPAVLDDGNYWLGYQNGCMVSHPDTGSFFHGDNWDNFTVPGPGDVAKFGTGCDPQHNGDRPHYIHFGDTCVNVFACPNSVPILGGNVTNAKLEMQSGSWTFDFGTGQVGACTLPGSTTGNYTLTDGILVGDTVKSTGFPDTASLTVTGPGALSGSWMSLGEPVGATGSVTVTGADGPTSLNLSGWSAVGHLGSGELHILDGAQVSAETTHVAWNAGSTGLVIVSGVGSAWTHTGGLDIGEGGVATMTVSNGGAVSNTVSHIGNALGSNGIVTITGTGSTWDISDGRFEVGAFGTGRLDIMNGAQVAAPRTVLGFRDTGEGAITVDGPSTWSVGGELWVAEKGHGTLSISNGGSVITPESPGFIGARNGADGQLTVTGTGSTFSGTSQLYVGGSWWESPTGVGGLSVSQGGDVSVGHLKIAAGGQGTMTVDTGGTVSSTSARIAEAEGSNGAVTVTGVGSTWSILEGFDVGSSGQGTLTVQTGGTLESGRATVGNQAGSVGTASVTGTGSTWTNTENLTVGDVGDGTLTIANGGSVSNANGKIGWRDGAIGSVTVTGTGSTWANTGVQVGESGGSTGSLLIETGGQVTGTWATVGHWAQSTGSVTVTGPASQWALTENLTVGDMGEGMLAIANGGSVSNANGKIGWRDGAIGSVTVTGTGSTWTNTGSLQVSLDGQGTLTVADGGRVTASALTVNANGQVYGDGTLEGPVVNSGEIHPGLSPGALTVEGDYTQNADGTLMIELGGTAPGTEHDQLIVTGNASLNGTLDIVLVNGFVPTPGDTFEIMTFTSVTGHFARVACPNLGGGLSANLAVGINNVMVKTGIDCNANCLDDAYETATGLAPDCNSNGIPDECDIADGTSGDCNNNGIPDECDIAGGTSLDQDADGIPDECVFWTPLNPIGVNLWSVSVNWDPQVVPDNTVQRTFNVTVGGTNESATLDINAEVNTLRLLQSNTLNVTMGDLTLESSFGMLNDGNLFVGEGHSLTAAAPLPIEGTGTVELDGPQAHLSSSSWGNTLTNRVAIVGEGVIDADFHNEGTVTADLSGTTLKVTGTLPKVNDATFKAVSGATLDISDTTVTGTGRYVADGGTISLLRGLGGGTITGDSMEVFNGGLFEAGWNAAVSLTGTMSISACGSYQAATTPVSASLTAGEIVITEGPSGGGHIVLEGSMSVEALTSITLTGSGPGGGVAGGCDPPGLNARNTSMVTAQTMDVVAGAFVYLTDTADMAIQQTLTLAGGSYGRGAGLLASSATLSAGHVLISSAGQMLLEDAMSTQCDGDFILSLDPTCAGCVPPRWHLLDQATLSVGGRFAIPESADIRMESTSNGGPNAPFALAGDFDNQSIHPETFGWSAGSMTLDGGGPNQTFEVAGEDLGPWFIDNFRIGTLEVDSGSSVSFVDNIDNDLSGQNACTEAQYVGVLTLRSGSTITIDNCRVYYDSLVDEGGTVTLVGCGELVRNCADSLDADCDLDLDDYGVFVPCFAGPRMPAAGGCEFADLDQDGQVDLKDFAIFQQSFTESRG